MRLDRAAQLPPKIRRGAVGDGEACRLAEIAGNGLVVVHRHHHLAPRATAWESHLGYVAIAFLDEEAAAAGRGVRVRRPLLETVERWSRTLRDRSGAVATRRDDRTATIVGPAARGVARVYRACITGRAPGAAPSSRGSAARALPARAAGRRPRVCFGTSGSRGTRTSGAAAGATRTDTTGGAAGTARRGRRSRADRGATAVPSRTPIA